MMLYVLGAILSVYLIAPAWLIVTEPLDRSLPKTKVLAEIAQRACIALGYVAIGLFMWAGLLA
jgi:hypothetical protein